MQFYQMEMIEIPSNVYVMMIQILKGQEIWHWEDKANVGWYAAVEEGVWCWHYHGGILLFFYQTKPFFLVDPIIF